MRCEVIFTMSLNSLLIRVRKQEKLTQERMSDGSVRQIVRRYLGENFTAHSLRASFVTVARRNGASTTEIMRQTGHKTETMVRNTPALKMPGSIMQRSNWDCRKSQVKVNNKHPIARNSTQKTLAG